MCKMNGSIESDRPEINWKINQENTIDQIKIRMDQTLKIAPFLNQKDQMLDNES